MCPSMSWARRRPPASRVVTTNPHHINASVLQRFVSLHLFHHEFFHLSQSSAVGPYHPP